MGWSECSNKDFTEWWKTKGHECIKEETSIAGLCPTNWSPYQSSCYRVFTTPLTRDQAQAECQKQNSNLASVLHDGTNTFIASLQGDSSIWIDANRSGGLDPKVGWKWGNKAPWQYQNWNTGEPNGEDNLCAAQSGEKWNDAACSDQLAYVCSKKNVEATASSVYDHEGCVGKCPPCPDATREECWGPQLAVDGKTILDRAPLWDGYYHSKTEDYPWLQIKLTSPQTITGLVIVNRYECCGERLKNLEIRAGLVPVLNGFRGLLSVNKKVGFFPGPGVTGETYNINFPATTAQYVTLQIRDRS